MYRYIEHVNELLIDLQNAYNITEVTMTFYRQRVAKFFDDYMGLDANENKPLNAITYFDINTYLESLTCGGSEKVNCYNSLKRFFGYTYLMGITPEIISHVNKPNRVSRRPRYLSEDDYETLRAFIVDRQNPIQDRLILGLFLLTGLSRKYIVNLNNSQFIYENGTYKLRIWDNTDEVLLPLKSELQIIVNDYLNEVTEDSRLGMIISSTNENSLTTYVKNKTQRILGHKHTPTELSNTFVKKALMHGNRVWEISKLTLESIGTIEKHIQRVEDLFVDQSAILNSF